MSEIENFSPLAKNLHCRRQWRHGQISPLIWWSRQYLPGADEWGEALWSRLWLPPTDEDSHTQVWKVTIKDQYLSTTIPPLWVRKTNTSRLKIINCSRFTREADVEGMTSFNKKLTSCAEELTKKVHRDHMSIWWETLQQLFAPLEGPISKPFAAFVESPMGRLSSCLIRANLDGSDGPPVFYVLLVISRNLGGRDAITLPGKYTRKKTWNFLKSSWQRCP